MSPETKFWSSRIALASILGLLAWHGDVVNELKSPDARAAAGVVAQIGATMLGFVLAALAILMSISSSRLIRNMQRTGHYQVLITRMFGCIASFGLLALLGLVLLFVPVLRAAYVYPFFVLLLVSVFILYDVARKFWIVLSHVHPDRS